MGFQVVDTEQGLIEPEGKSFGAGEPDEQGTGQSGAIGDGDAIDVGPGKARGLEGLVDHFRQMFDMHAGSDFRHHSAIGTVMGDLGKNDI